MALSHAKRKELINELQKHKDVEFLEQQRDNIEKKNIGKGFERCLNIQRREWERELEANEKTQAHLMRESKIKRDEKLAYELKQVKDNELLEQQRRQLLRQNSIELRELERKLKAAYGAKELKAQMAQREANRLQEKIREKAIHEVLVKGWTTAAELHHQKLVDELCKKQQYKQELQDQMIYKEKNKRYLYEEFLREKKMLDEIIERINDEDERAIQEKMCKMQKTRDEMNAFKAAQAVWREKKKKDLEEENLRIQEYIKKISDEERRRYDEQQKEKARQEALIEKLSREIYVQEKKRKEREEILEEIREEEQKALIEKKFRESVEKQIKLAKELRESCAKQLEEKAQRLRAEAEADARYKEELLKKIKEDEKIEQLTAEKKRVKMLQLRKDVEEMMRERRQKRAEELQELMKIYDEEQNEMREKQRIIEEERIKMLQEHAHNLIGYLPRGLIRVEDLPHLGSDVAENFTHLLKK